MPKSEFPDKMPLESILASLPADCTIDHYKKHEHTLELFVSWPEPKGTARICPYCNSDDCAVKDSGTMQTIRHINNGFYGTMITYHKPRLVCRTCGRSFYVKPEWAFPHLSCSSAVVLQIFDELTGTAKSITAIARDTFTTPAIVTTFLERVSYDRPKKLPVSLGIDEFKGNSGFYDPQKKCYHTEKYHCVLSDVDAGHVIDILYKATYPELRDYFMQYSPEERKRVRYFCTDMRSGFSKVARNFFPHAKICIDMFHVVKLLTDAVGDIRLDAWHNLTKDCKNALAAYKDAKQSSAPNLSKLKAAYGLLKENCSLLKNSHRALITSPYHASTYWGRHPEKHEERLEKLFALDPRLKPAHTALMDFYDVMEEVRLEYHRSHLDKWLETYLSCDCPPIRQAAYSINKRRKGIENSWKYKKSNGVTESLNQKSKNIIRASFGMRSFEHLRKRILLASGATTVETKNPYTIFGEKRGDETSDDV